MTEQFDSEAILEILMESEIREVLIVHDGEVVTDWDLVDYRRALGHIALQED